VTAVIAGIVMPMTIDAIEQLIAGDSVHVRWAGMTSFWGYLAGGAAVAVVCRRHGLPLARLGDVAAAPMGVALVLSRIGCFLGGCDYGKVTSVPWAVRFPSGSPAWQDHLKAGLLPPERASSLPVHPTQLYEALLGLVIVAVAVWASRRTWREGRVFLTAAATYSVGRIVVEVFRGDLGRGIHAGLSSGQIFSLCVLAAIAIGLTSSRIRLAGAAAAAALVFALLPSHVAHAQPGAAGPQPQSPYDDPQPAPAPSPPPLPVTRRAPVVAPPPRSPLHISIGGFGGLAAPINRRPEQVPALAGLSLSLGIAGDNIGGWIDIDSYGNQDASHGTVLISAGTFQHITDRLAFGGRVGIGPTLVNFDEPAFRDVTGTTVRVDGIIEYAMSPSWHLELRPLTFDGLFAADLGGPIVTYQIRIGLAYDFTYGRTK
jgi:phosphatidylglycerol:prolipoprotein diacylglycerol transferase